MIEVQVDARVQMIQDIPELGLHRGEMGFVCSTWFAPTTAYEVEFRRKMPECWIRALLMPAQIAVESESCGSLFAGIAGT